MDVLQIGAELLKKRFGDNVDSGALAEALTGLLGSGGSGFNLQDVVSQIMSSGGMRSIVESWLGDGANEEISADQLTSFIDADRIKGFADALGLGEDDAKNGLAEALPQMIDKVSHGGNLLGGSDSILDMAKKLF